MAKLLDNQRWQVKRGNRPYSRLKLVPIREYGPDPENGDELVPASAFDKALAALKAAQSAPTRALANNILDVALADLED